MLRRMLIILVISILNATLLYSQTKAIKVSGSICQYSDSSPIPNVSIYNQSGKLITTTDNWGNFSLKITQLPITLNLKHVAYQDSSVEISNKTFVTPITIRLIPKTRLQEEVVVIGSSKKRAISGLSSGKINLSLPEFDILPRFLGSNDPLRLLQLMPGIQTSNEGNSGVYVQGGEPGHNLVLLNDAPIYNPSHLLGLFSVFNSDHISNFEIQKGHMEVQYGGRLASVIHGRSSDEIAERFRIKGNVGILSAQLTLDIPINEKQSLSVSGRQSFFGLILRPFFNAAIQDSVSNLLDMKYEFQDFNATYIARPTASDKIIVNGYWGNDKFLPNIPECLMTGDIRWENGVASVGWQHSFSENTQMQHTLYTSHYTDKLKTQQSQIEIAIPSSIHEYGYKGIFSSDYKYFNFKLGGEYAYQLTQPQDPQSNLNEGDSNNWSRKKQIYFLHLPALYASLTWQPTSRFSIEGALRFSAMFQTEPISTIHNNLQQEIITDTHYSSSEKVCSYSNFDPRILVQYRLTPQSSAQLSYDKRSQYLHWVSVSSNGLPTDFWMPSTTNIQPEKSHNFAASYFRSFLNSEYELSLGLYYRTMSGLLEYNQNILDLLNQIYRIEECLFSGKGKAYGTELLFKKTEDLSLVGLVTPWDVINVHSPLSTTDAGFRPVMIAVMTCRP